jgi:tetratricopeptide (TPR) repeat protein
MRGQRAASESAEDLIDKAWDAPNRSKRAHYARLALDADPTAIDAYVALSFTVPTFAEYVALLREAVRLGGIRWRKEIDDGMEPGFFWSDVDTRPYMRAVHNLALALWSREERGPREEAIELVERLLHLNPNDNQGVRYLALAWYPVLGNWRRCEKILADYSGDGGPECSYARCLAAFRDKRDPRVHLRQAVSANPYVPDLLLGKVRRPPSRSDGYVAVRSPEEALSYVENNREAWEAVPGALAWLGQAVSAFHPAKAAKRSARRDR